MPRNASGIYSRPAGTTPAPNDLIESAKYNQAIDDLGNEITLSLPRNGSAPMTGDLDAGNNIIKNLAAGQANTDAVNVAQLEAGLVSLRGQRKNYVYNATFNHWQRVTTEAITVETVVADGWYSNDGNGGAATINQKEHIPGQTDVPGQPKFFFEHVQTIAASTAPYLWHKVEGVEKLEGETVTLTFFAKCDSGTQDITPNLFQSFGTGGSPSASVTTTLTPITIGTTWTLCQAVATMPSISGKTLGSNGNDFTGFFIQFPISATYTIDVSLVSLVSGDASGEGNPAAPVSEAQDLDDCRRFRKIIQATDCQGAVVNSSVIRVSVGFAPMRADNITLTLLDSTPSFYEGATLRNATGAGIGSSSGNKGGAVFTVNGFTGLTANTVVYGDSGDNFLLVEAYL